MADECLHDFLHSFIKDVEGHSLFEIGSLSILNQELKQYGYQMAPTHHMFLPCRNVEVEKRFQVKWLYDNEINSFYGNPLFPLQLMERTLWGWQVVQKMRHIGNKLELMFYQNIVQKE